MNGCTEVCWTPVDCPNCGAPASPFGRDDRAPSCTCEPREGDGLDWEAVRRRHLWSEHDSARWYIDPEGWKAHEAACETCRGES